MAPTLTDATTDEHASYLEASAAKGRAEDDAAAKRERRRKLVHYFGMPIFLVVVLGLLYLYVSGLELDNIEARNLRQSTIVGRTQEHIVLTLLSTLFVLLLAIPLGILATRPRFRRVTPVIIGLGNAGQAIPSIGMLGLIFFLAANTALIPRSGTVPAVIALVAYSFLAILRNTMVGLEQVDRSVLEAGRGMGMSELRVLRKIELPLAVPVILAGVRTALVLNVGTATLAYFVGAGGLGEIIITGIGLSRVSILITGAVLTAVLALLVDYIAGLVEEVLTPKGL